MIENYHDPATMFWQDEALHLLDQRSLPQTIEYRICRSYQDVAASIADMTVRGAPAIGISAAFGMALAAREALKRGYDRAQATTFLEQAVKELYRARPTAVNLGWALERTGDKLAENHTAAVEEIATILLKEAQLIHDEDVDCNRRIGFNGAKLVPPRASILTHCNAGALATGGYGTALGVVRAAAEQGKQVHVYADETRPLLQGARITAFELCAAGIDATLITDNAAGHLMSLGKVDLVVVGADRIAANGDTANKIGTYSLAVLAGYHRIPFYVAAPLSTIDLQTATGKEIIIEERCASEITHLYGSCMAPDKIKAFNPAFDVTPAKLITALITEAAVVFRPNGDKLSRLFKRD